MSSIREIRDPIHGFILPTAVESKVIDSPVFQRLRRISQLAMAHLVYPGAHHSRFEHCLGTMHVAGKIAARLKADEECIRLAGLLHDIGHGPFSHVSENLLSYFTDDLEGTEEIHERVTLEVLESNPELEHCLSSSLRDKIKTLISKKGAVESKIISGPLDADKMDYLLRDSHYAGVKYGVFDLARLIRGLISVKDEELGVNIEDKNAVEQFLLAKYYMDSQVYRHKVRLVSDAMITRGAEIAADEGLEEVRELFTFRKDAAFAKKYLEYDDEALFNLIMNNKKTPISSGYYKRLRERRLFKVVSEINLSKELEDATIRLRALNLTRDQLSQLESVAANILKLDVKQVIAAVVSLKNPTYRSPGADIGDETILVQKGEYAKHLSEESALLSASFAQSKSEPILHLYAPLDHFEEKECDKVKTTVGKEIMKALESL